MPLEDVIVTLVIGTHSDSLPLNGAALAQILADAVADYAGRHHDPLEVVECDSVQIEGQEYLDQGDPRGDG